MDIFRVRLNCVDHYQATPTAFDPQFPGINGSNKQRAVPKIPVIRVFGATETGQKVCAHVHGALPYLYVGYDGSLIPEDGEVCSRFVSGLLLTGLQSPSTSVNSIYPSTVRLLLVTAVICTREKLPLLDTSLLSEAFHSMATMSAISSFSRYTC